MKLETAMKNGKTVYFDKNPELRKLMEQLILHLEGKEE